MGLPRAVRAGARGVDRRSSASRRASRSSLIFGIARGLLPDAGTVLLATVRIGVGMALVGPILSMIVRRRLPNHPAAGTGAYVVGFIAGGTIAAAAAVPLADAFGGWRGSFAIIAAAAFVSLAAWVWLMPRDHGHVRVAPSRPRLPWRRPSAWLIGVIFGTQSILFYGCITWLASVYRERGWPEADAGGLIALLTGIGLAGTLAVPLFADKLGTRRAQLTLAAAMSVAGAVIVALTPGEQPGRSPRSRDDRAPGPRHRRVLPARADAAGGRRQ
jgi:CP family cyanate transporter-like MFS transporter